MITPSVARIKQATETAFADDFASGRLYQLGVYNRRPIAGTAVWSQHAWGNAWDIGARSLTDGDRVAGWLRTMKDTGSLPIGTILWRVKNHFDHVHVEGLPKQTGTPPAAPTRAEVDDMESIKGIQRILNAAGFTDAKGRKLTVDGKWGPNTEAAFMAMAKRASSGSVDVTAVSQAVRVDIARRLG